MNAEVIAIGTELLLGFVVNTDTAYLGRVLAGLGIGCYRQVTVGDNPSRLAEAIRTALGRADLVITCGGLGPTVDDVTLETIARATGRRLVLNRSILREIETRFKRQGIRMPASNRRQALLPEGAVPFTNQIGTAPGFLLRVHGSTGSPRTRWVVALPGPPAELKPMVERRLIPRLRKLSGGNLLRSRTLKLTGVSESEVDAKVRGLLAMQGAATVGIYAHPGQVDLRITACGKSDREAQRRIAAVEQRIRARVGRLLYGADEETLEGVVGQLLKKRRKTLAVAESCTGGLLAERVTRISGSSAYFLGGVVSYSNELKSVGLSVPPLLLRRYGAVSAEVSRAMAEGIRRLAGSDFGLAITGIAGPTGGTKGKPVGLVYLSLSGTRGTKTHRFLFTGDRARVPADRRVGEGSTASAAARAANRATIRLKASQAALNLLRLHLLG